MPGISPFCEDRPFLFCKWHSIGNSIGKSQIGNIFEGATKPSPGQQRPLPLLLRCVNPGLMKTVFIFTVSCLSMSLCWYSADLKDILWCEHEALKAKDQFVSPEVNFSRVRTCPLGDIKKCMASPKLG